MVPRMLLSRRIQVNQQQSDALSAEPQVMIVGAAM